MRRRGTEGQGQATDVREISRPDDLRDIANLGLTLVEAKLLLAGFQREVVAAQARTDALGKALAERQAEEGRKLVESQRAEMDQLRADLDRNIRENLDRRDANDRREAEDLRRRQKQARASFDGVIDSVWSFFSPARAAEREAERQREQQRFAARQKQERDDYAALLQQTNKLEIENREELHALRLHELEVRGAEERDRYLREQELARELQAENEERERQLAEQRARDGPKRAR